MLTQFEQGSIQKSYICNEVFQGLAQQWREKVEIKRYHQHWFGEGEIKHLGYLNTETLVIEKRPRYVR